MTALGKILLPPMHTYLQIIEVSYPGYQLKLPSTGI
jgi:hypothetical protein